MDPRLRSLVIVLVGAAVGAVVAGGAISYVNSSAPPEKPLTMESAEQAAANAPYADSSENPAASENVARADDGSGTVDVSARDQTDVAPVDASSRSDDDGPTATVTTDANAATPPTKKSAPKKKPAPVVEEEGDAPKASENGGLRDSDAKESDGGAIR